jgi:geranylgeranyl diphosphate synthase type I
MTHDEPPLRRRIDAALSAFAQREVERLQALDVDLTPLADSARDFVMAGGKRLRPLFCYWSWRATAGGSSPAAQDAVIAAAASLELVQACALAHDDVIDASDSRRGRPSLHREWEARHTAAQWDGDPERFGRATSILLGDVFLAWSDSMLAGSGLSESQLARARPVWDLMRTELLAGQYLDVAEQARAESSIDRSLRIAALKSGRYSVERPILLGAAIAGAPARTVAALGEFGRDVGVAFQLRDDLLGVFGDPSLTGKPAGDDLREGKRTVLVAVALAAADSGQREFLREHIGAADLPAVEITAIQDLLRSLGAVDTVEQMIRERSDRAVRALESVDLGPAGREALLDLAQVAVQRQH